MSHDTYDKLCIEANGTLSELTQRDESWDSLKPIKDRNAVQSMLLFQFMEYVQLYKDFEISYDQILQPQKRLVIQKLLGMTHL